MSFAVTLSTRTVRIAAATTVAVLLLACVCPAHADGKPAKVKKESRRADSHQIESLEQDWMHALVKRDTASLEKLMDDDFNAVSANGTISDKEQYLHRVSGGLIAFSSIDVIDIKVKVQPTVAIVVSQVRAQGQLEGRPVNGIFRYLKVYGRSGAGPWRVLNMEATRVSGVNPEGTDMHPGRPISGSLKQ